MGSTCRSAPACRSCNMVWSRWAPAHRDANPNDSPGCAGQPHRGWSPDKDASPRARQPPPTELREPLASLWGRFAPPAIREMPPAAAFVLPPACRVWPQRDEMDVQMPVALACVGHGSSLLARVWNGFARGFGDEHSLRGGFCKSERLQYDQRVNGAAFCCRNGRRSEAAKVTGIRQKRVDAGRGSGYIASCLYVGA